MTKIRILFISLLCIAFGKSMAQNLCGYGKFNTRHFPILEYGSAAQIWGGIQNNESYLLFRNRQDILCYNGNEWKKINVDKEQTSEADQKGVSKSFVSSFFEGSDNRIYVGRENNFGYLDYSKKGEYSYFPLKIESEKTGFGKVWNIFEINNGEILFVAQKGLYTYKNNQVKSYPIPAEFKKFQCKTACKLSKGLLLEYQTEAEASEREYKYLYIDILTGKAKKILPQNPENVILKNIRGSFDINGTWYILDVSGSLVKIVEANSSAVISEVPKDFFSFVKNFEPNSIRREDKYIYYCTENGGLIISDLKGNIVRTFDFNDGLDNIYVRDFILDDDKNLWLCLDDGIQFVETSSPLASLKKKEGITSPIESISFHDGIPLLGLNTDIFIYKKVGFHNSVYPSDSLKQQIFDIETIGTTEGLRTLVIGYNGIYEYFPLSRKKEKVAEVYAYSFCKDPFNKNRVFVAEERGLGSITLINGKWVYDNLVADAGGETYSVTFCNGKVYFSIRNKGVGEYNLATKRYHLLKIPNSEDSDNQYYVQNFKNTLYVGTGNGIKYLDNKTGKLVSFAQNGEFFGKGYKSTIHRLINIDNKQLWVVIFKEFSENKFEFEAGWMEMSNGSWKYTKWPLAAIKGAGIASAIQKGPGNTVWIGTNEGLFIFDEDAIRERRSDMKIIIDRIDIAGKTAIYNVEHAEHLPELEYSKNSFRVTFHSNFFSTQGPTLYRYKLEGYSDNWSEWSELNFANFEKIGEGTYTLLVQSQNFYGQESGILKYEITVLPPWYRTIWAYILYFIGLIFIIIGVVRLSLIRVRQQNIKLEATVQERTKEIAEQNHQLELQKSEITQKSNDILDSIHYAKRIQNTILPAVSRLNELFDEHFVFYRPKDIVSGDFYWTREVQDKIIFSAVDCTGHGVPGALVSIVGNNGLLRAVNEFKLTEPNEILDKLREIVVSAFRSEGSSDVKDGMDIALCSIDYKTGELKFAGANNECVIIRKGEIIELKPDKQPIGQFVDAKPFTQKTFQLEPGDCIYLYTDGYVDQFGGERMKKYKSKPFKAFISTLFEKSMTEQYQIIQNEFDTWKAHTEQIDDVCVMAVKFKGIRP